MGNTSVPPFSSNRRDKDFIKNAAALARKAGVEAGAKGISEPILRELLSKNGYFVARDETRTWADIVSNAGFKRVNKTGDAIYVLRQLINQTQRDRTELKPKPRVKPQKRRNSSARSSDTKMNIPVPGDGTVKIDFGELRQMILKGVREIVVRFRR